MHMHVRAGGLPAEGTSNVRTPTIHLNGTGASPLQNGYEAAYRALTDAINAVNEASPNARDYYPQGAQAYSQAVKEHSRRLAALAQVRDELLVLHDSCHTGAAGGDVELEASAEFREYVASHGRGGGR